MFEDSDLLRRDVLVLRATAPPDAQFSVLDETGREIGRVIAEGRLVRNAPTRLVLYDRQHTPVLGVERREYSIEGGLNIPEYGVVDGRAQPVEDGRRVYTMKLERGRRFIREVGVFQTIRDATKADVGSFAQALPPQGDHRLGATFLFTITAEVSPELRLAALGYAINSTESSSRFPAWMVKRVPKGGLAWPGSAPAALTR